MSYPINYPTPQGANIQIFRAPSSATTTNATQEWVKPQGASFIWFTLIGAGGGGGGIQDVSSFSGSGGGSGGVTNCMIPAFLVPDILQIRVGPGGAGGGPNSGGTAGGRTVVFYQAKRADGYVLLTANAGAGGNLGNPVDNPTPPALGGAAVTATASTPIGFSAAGIYQSVAGQDSSDSAASPTTFLSGGVTSNSKTANYGNVGTGVGYFQMQPIIVGLSSAKPANSSGGRRGVVGCGGVSYSDNSSVNGSGGDGLVVIITW
jgi:hypothetical protein